MNKKIILPIMAIILVSILILSYTISQKKITIPTEQDTTGSSEVTPTVTSPPATQSPSATPGLTTTPDNLTGLYPAYSNVNDERRYGYIDESGALVIRPVFDYAYDFNEGVAVVVDDSIYKVINSSGTVVFENGNVINSFYNGAAVYGSYIGNKMLYGYVDSDGQVMIEPQFILADDFGEDDQAFVSTADGEYALINKEGNIIESFPIDVKLDYVYDLDDGFIIYSITSNNKVGVITIKGETIFEPIYSDITYLEKGLFAIKDSKLEYYEVTDAPAAIFNQEGTQLTDYTLYDVSAFHGDYSSATDNTSTFFIGMDGKEVTTLPKYEGRGKLTLEKDIIKAEVDDDLFYSNIQGTILWRSDNLTVLPSGIAVKRLKFKPLRNVLVHYPQVEGFADANVQDKVNTRLKSIFTEERAKITPEDMLSVVDVFQANMINNLLIISMSGYDYYAGAAHGMPLQNYYYIDIITGKFYELSDLFKTDSDYKSKLNEIISASIVKQNEAGDSMFFPESFVGLSDKPYFHVTEDMLTIYFYPYEITAYAAGFPEFAIPFEDLSDYVDTNGGFWNSLH